MSRAQAKVIESKNEVINLNDKELSLVNIDQLKGQPAVYDTEMMELDPSFECDWIHDANGAYGPYDYTLIEFSNPEIGERKVVRPAYLADTNGPYRLILVEASKGSANVDAGAQKFTVAAIK